MKTIIAGIMLLTLSGCGATADQVMRDMAIESVVVGALTSLPPITPEKLKEAEKVVNPDMDGR